MYGQHEEFDLEENRQSGSQNDKRKFPPVSRYSGRDGFAVYDEETQKAAEKVNDRNGWDGNLYSYHFVDKDEESQKAADKVNDRNGWDGNLYSYHFIDKDEESQNVADKVNRHLLTNGQNEELHAKEVQSSNDENVKRAQVPPEAHRAAVKVNDRNGWDGNLYSYHFVDKDINANQAHMTRQVTFLPFQP